MSTKVEPASTAEPHRLQGTAMAAASTNTPKISMFAAKSKSGFVIPKNKLSGSLVPILRGGKKLGGSDAANEESTKQVQRKTKWSPDLTQDAAVRKGRALAYQTRVDQITKQLKLGIFAMGDNQDSAAADDSSEHESSGHINENSELLELERREAIGEILKLNPSYKTPPDYKPLLKEAQIPIPFKEYPGYNFVGLIFGPASDTQKRLEKETGAKVLVYGTKRKTGEKVEITPSDGNEIHNAYEELYVHVSADGYEKIDTAVALIELLVKPVSANQVSASTTSASNSGDNVNGLIQSQGTSTPYTVPPVGVEQGVAQPIMGSVQTPPRGQFQPYPGPWFPIGPPQTPINPPPGSIPPPNPSAPLLSNPVQVIRSSFNPSTMPSLFGPRPLLAAGLGLIPQNPTLVSHGQHPPALQRPYMPQLPPLGNIGPPRNPPLQSLQHLTAQPNISAPPPLTGNPSTPIGPPPVVRPAIPSFPQPGSRPPSGPQPEWPVTPVGNSTQWSQLPPGTSPSIGQGSMAQMATPILPPRGPHPVAAQSTAMSGAPQSNFSAVNIVSSVPFPSRPSAPEPSSTTNRPIGAPVFTTVLQSQVGLPPASPSLLLAPAPIQPSPAACPNPVLGTTPIPPSGGSTSMLPSPSHLGISSSGSGAGPNFTPMKPPSVIAPKPQHPSSSNFTFQPHRPQTPVSQVVPAPNSHPSLPLQPPLQPPMGPQTQSFRVDVRSPTPPPGMQGFPRPQINNHITEPRPQISVPFAGNPTVSPAPLRHAVFPNAGPVAANLSVPQIGPRNFNQAPPMANSAGPFPPRPRNPMQPQQNYPGAAIRPQNLLAPNQQFSSSPSFASGMPASNHSGVQQIYDPFSPTSASLAPQARGNAAKARPQDNDPEYEDLMASVGVK